MKNNPSDPIFQVLLWVTAIVALAVVQIFAIMADYNHQITTVLSSAITGITAYKVAQYRSGSSSGSGDDSPDS
jgi:hypothetical protein